MPYKDPVVRREKQKEINRAFVERHRSERPEGVCSTFPMCHNMAEDGFKKCAKCRAYMRQYKLKYRQQEAPEGVCTNFPDCHNVRDSEAKACSSCREKQNANSKKPQARQRQAVWRKRLEVDVFSAYGNRCACCGEQEMTFLTIDHIEPYDGTGPRSGSQLYAWLKTRGYPSGFRTLCYSCNFSLGHHGYCPHGDLKQECWAVKVGISGQEAKRAEKRARWIAYKMDVFMAYGGPKCSCCGEDRNEFLTIEHMDRAGADHRKSDPGAKNICIWLKQHGYPDGYEVMCLNCNRGRHHSPDNICPHARALTPLLNSATIPA